jgi:tetraacyldisaccharide-1-P 4'-kinase
LHTEVRIEFEDHHVLPAARSCGIWAGSSATTDVEAVVTTEKDLVNLCEDPDHFLEPLPLYWLRIGVQIDREDEFLEAIAQRLR